MDVAAGFALFVHSINFLVPLYLLISDKAPWKKHTAWFFSLFVFWLLTWANPCYHIFNGTVSFHNATVLDVFPNVIWIYFWSIGVFNGIYWFYASADFRLNQPLLKMSMLPIFQKLQETSWVGKLWLIIPPYLCLLAQWTDMQATGVNMLDLYNPWFTDSNYTVWLYQPINPYFQALGDSLMVWVIAAFVFRTPWWHRVLIVYLAFTLFFLEAWRYRTILTALGILVHYAWNFKSKEVWKPVLLCLVFGYITLFATNNRWHIAHRNFEEITLNPIGIGIEEALVKQTNNFVTDAALYKYVADSTGLHDLGQSTFGYSLYRFVPKSLFNNNDKGEPPIIKAQKQSIGKTGEVTEIGAHTNIMEYWFGFGNWGSVILMLFLAITLAHLNFDLSNRKNRVSMIAVLIMVFQIITRGFTPQHIELLLFLCIPLSGIWLLISDKNSAIKSVD
jgi:hypothetical protein